MDPFATENTPSQLSTNPGHSGEFDLVDLSNPDAFSTASQPGSSLRDDLEEGQQVEEGEEVYSAPSGRSPSPVESGSKQGAASARPESPGFRTFDDDRASSSLDGGHDDDTVYRRLEAEYRDEISDRDQQEYDRIDDMRRQAAKQAEKLKSERLDRIRLLRKTHLGEQQTLEKELKTKTGNQGNVWDEASQLVNVQQQQQVSDGLRDKSRMRSILLKKKAERTT